MGEPLDEAKLEDKLLNSLGPKVSTQILGQDHTGWRQFAYGLDVFGSDQFVRAPKNYWDYNLLFGLIYYAGVIAFIVDQVAFYLNQLPVESSTMVPLVDMDPVYLNITTACSARHKCSNWTWHWSEPSSQGEWVWVQHEKIKVSAQWTNMPADSPCANTSGSFEIDDDANFLATVCYSSTYGDGIKIDIPFTSAYSSGNFLTVDIAGDASKYDNDLRSVVQMEPTQLKTVFFNQAQYVDINGETVYSPYTADFFYNGHNVELQDASVFFALQQFGYKTEQTVAMSWLDTLGAIGGFSGLWLTLVGMVRSVIHLSYKTHYDMKTERQKGILATVAACIFCQACCRCGSVATAV